MPGIPVICEHCEHVFESRLIGLSGTITNLTLRNNREQCPRCRQQTRLLDGLFNYRGGTLELVHGPRVTVDALVKIRRILEEANENQSPKEIESKIQEETGERDFLRRILKWAKKLGYAIDETKDWHGRALFVLWLIREILGALGDR